MHRARIGLFVVVYLAGAGALASQVRSPVQDLLATARTAINDLRFNDADSITREILNLDQLRRAERIQALQLSAGALFPEQVPAQHRDRALESLRQLVRIAPSAGLPQEVTWPGLEALLREARLSTFGASASPRDLFILTGPEGTADIDVATSRGGRLTLVLEPVSGGPAIQMDRTPIENLAKLHLRVMANGRPSIPSGKYQLVITAIDNIAPDTIRLVYSATVTAPPLDYVDVPVKLDSTFLRPEKTRPNHKGGVIAGIVAMAGTVALSRMFREAPVKALAGTDNRAVPLGIALGVGTAGGVWLLDKGAPLPDNIAANEKTRADFARRVIDAKARNAELLRTYRAEIKLDPEVKQ